MKRVFTIGERIWDAHDSRWGTIILLAGTDKYKKDILSADQIVTYKPDDSDGECETIADDVYQIAEGVTFQGEQCVWEHTENIDYPFFCPGHYENAYHFETDKKSL